MLPGTLNVGIADGNIVSRNLVKRSINSSILWYFMISRIEKKKSSDYEEK